nr:capsid protein [Tanacetum cinerariifolium]
MSSSSIRTQFTTKLLHIFIIITTLHVTESTSAYRRDPGHPQWHHSAFHDVKDSVRSDVHRMLHSRAEVPFQVPLEVNVILVGFSGDGGYRYTLDSSSLQEFLQVGFPSLRPSCLETGEPLDIEHHMVFNVVAAAQPEVIALEKALKAAMVPAGTAREADFGREVPAFEIDAAAVEPEFEKLYSYLFYFENIGYSNEETDRPMPTAIFIVNFDKVRMDPRNKDINLDCLMYDTLDPLTEEDMNKQEGGYVYRYRYNGGGSSQIWLSSGRFVVVDISAGPCTYGRLETDEGSVSSKTIPRLQNVMSPQGSTADRFTTQDNFVGQLAALIGIIVEHLVAPDVRFETVDLATRLLIPIIVLQNHNRYNIMEKGRNYSLDIGVIEDEVRNMVHKEEDVVIVGGSHSLHLHEKLAIAVSKAMRGHSLQETKKDGRFHVHTKMYLDGAILKEEMERSADVLAAGLLEVSDPSLSDKFFNRQKWMDEMDGPADSVLKHKPIRSYEAQTRRQKNKRVLKKHGDLHWTYGTRVVPVFVLSLADVDPHLMMEDESLLWTSNDVVIVLQHGSEKIPLSYVSETERLHVVPSQVQRHIVAGLASVVGGLSAPYERVSHIHERPVVNWLLAAGCHPFGPFSNISRLSQLLQDVTLRNTIYARVDSALHRIREMSESVEAFAGEYLKTPLGEPVKGKKNKTTTELWLEKFYKHETNLPEPFPHELVERLETYLDSLEEQLVDLSSLLYDHRLQDAYINSTDILESSIFTQQYVDHVLENERERMKCCRIEYSEATQSSQGIYYAVILLAGLDGSTATKK